jgi:hypothetical protein
MVNVHYPQMRFTLIFLAGFVSLFLITNTSSGTHLRGGEIQIRTINCNSLTVEVTLVIYVSLGGTQVGGEDDFLSFGDGTRFKVPETPVTEIIDGNLRVGKTIVRLQYTYKEPGRYVISYNEPNRNEGVVNMDQSFSTRFQIESMIVLERGTCNSYPVLLNAPIDRACTKAAFFHNPGGFDADNDSLSYELAIPKKDDTNPVANYRFPNHSSFYTAFTQGNEAGNGTPTFEIDPHTGMLKWDAPGATSEYSAAIKIREWKKRAAGDWYESSYIIRDMQILVTECSNKRPDLLFPEEVCVVAGEQVVIPFLASDPDGDSVRVDFFSELFQVASHQPVISPSSSTGNFLASQSTITFTMVTSCTKVREKPYLLNVKIIDRRNGDLPLARYYTVKISVIAPPPKIESVIVNPVSKQVALHWSISPCETVESFQVWRRTSSVTFSESACGKGMPLFLRYDLIAVVPSSQKTFTDTNLAIGSQYCYRILAIVTGNIQGKLSLDTCLIPKPAEAPVITNVSIEETDSFEGKILVKWTSPFEIDKSQYPPPFKYQVFRKNETLNSPFERVGDLLADTAYVDESLNTSAFSYRYFIELYVDALTNQPVDSSSQASSIVAASQSRVGQIDLYWSANTPWSNYSDKNSNHLIFRSLRKDGPFELVDSINVLINGLAYSDRGKYKNAGLARDPYFYKIKTRGTYGNLRVREPLENLSAVFAGQVLDTIPPCAPIVKIENIECAQFSCDGKSYYTSLRWESTDPACDEDVVRYEVLAKSDSAQHYVSLGMTTQAEFRHSNLTNLDYCYRIVSIDHLGNRSDSSAMVCNSSCLSFRLPNVITPGTLDDKNDFLATYDGDNSSEDQCARSVKRVELLVYNRWGQEVFLKEINNQDTNILWPGINHAGIEVESGVYFFKAKVDFQTNDPLKRNQEVKGWVHVLR